MKTIYHILFSLLFVLAFVGCDDDDDKVIERNQLKLTKRTTTCLIRHCLMLTFGARKIKTKRLANLLSRKASIFRVYTPPATN